MLAVVQHQHRALVREDIDQPPARLVRGRQLLAHAVDAGRHLFAESECGEHGRCHIQHITDGSELDEPDTVRTHRQSVVGVTHGHVVAGPIVARDLAVGDAIAHQPTRGLDGQPGLPGAARSVQCDQTRFLEHRDERLDLVITSDEAGQPRRHPLPGRPRSGVRCRCRLRRHRRFRRRWTGSGVPRADRGQLSAQCREMDVLKFLGRIETQLVVQPPAGPLICGHRLRLPAHAGQRADQQSADPFTERIVGGHRVQLGHHVGMPAEQEGGLIPILDGGQPCLVQTHRCRLGERCLPQIRQHRSSPQGQRFAEQFVGGLDLTVSQRLSSLARTLLELAPVDVRFCDGQNIPGRPRLDGEPRVDSGRAIPYRRSTLLNPRRIAGRDQRRPGQGARCQLRCVRLPCAILEATPQARDHGLQRVRDTRRRAVLPQRVDQGVDRHRSARIQREPRQQRARSPGADLDRPAVRSPHLQRSQYPDAHPTSFARNPLAAHMRSLVGCRPCVVSRDYRPPIGVVSVVVGV